MQTMIAAVVSAAALMSSNTMADRLTVSGAFQPYYALTTVSYVSGSEVKNDVPLASFNEIAALGPMDVYVTVGATQNVTVSGKEKYAEKLSLTVDDGRLELALKGTYRFKADDLRIDIVVEALNKVALKGSGDLSVKGVEADSFEVDLKGSGDLVLKDAITQKLSVSLTGSGDVKLDGTCVSASFNLKGSGDISAEKMVCETVTAYLKGSGDIDLRASDTADVTLEGSGDVDVYGSPKNFSSSTRGSGDISRR